VKEKTLVIDQVVSKVAVLFHGGTSGSNPVRSTGQSATNRSGGGFRSPLVAADNLPPAEAPQGQKGAKLS